MTTEHKPTKRLPTKKQYVYLRALGDGGAIICGQKRETEMYLRRGWVTAEWRDEKQYPYVWIRITPDGAEAAARLRVILSTSSPATECDGSSECKAETHILGCFAGPPERSPASEPKEGQ